MQMAKGDVWGCDLPSRAGPALETHKSLVSLNSKGPEYALYAINKSHTHIYIYVNNIVYSAYVL